MVSSGCADFLIDGIELDWISLGFFSENKPKELVPLAKSWLNPPKMELKNNNKVFYEAAERAYVVNDLKNGILEGKLLANPNQPAWKPEIILNNIRIVNPKVMINKQILEPDKDYKYGIVQELDQWKTIIWIDAIFNENIDFLIQ